MKKIFIIPICLIFSAPINAATNVDDFASLRTALQQYSDSTNPVNIMADVFFTNIINIGTDSYIQDNDYIFDGGRTYDSDGEAVDQGVEGFRILNGNQYFYGLDMQNFHSDSSGGAILKNGGSLYIYDSTFDKNVSYDFMNIGLTYGGAVDNFSGTVNVHNSVFTDNFAKNGGGAIVTSDILNIYNSVFMNNSSYSELLMLGSYGGAIANYGTTRIADSLFESNSATALHQDGMGGAIYNEWGEYLYVKNSVFRLNNAKNTGGAIHNEGILTVSAENGNTVFAGNTDGSGSNSIYNNADLILKADNGQIIFNDKVAGTVDSDLTIENINGGEVVLNADMRDVCGTTELKNGTIKIGHNIGNDPSGYINMFGTGMTVNTVMGGKSIIDFQNTNMDNFNAGNNLILNSDLYAAIDVNLATRESDIISNLNNASGSGSVVIDNILLADNSIIVNDLSIQVADNSGDKIVLGNSAKVISGAVFDYAVDDSNLQTTGQLNFTSIATTDSVLISTNARTAKTMLLANVSKYVLTPNKVSTPVPILSQYGSVGFDDYGRSGASIWVDTKGLSEDINVDNAEIKSDSYVALVGVDLTDEINKDWSMIYSFYSGYVGSKQSEADINAKQNGFALGAGVRAEIGDFFTAFTGNFISSHAVATTMDGDEDFQMLSGSVANKTGFNFDLYNKKLVLQPSVLTGYHLVHTKDYTNAMGVYMQSEDVQVLHVAPELKIATSIGSGIFPYVSGSYNWNFDQGGEITADEVLLPYLSVKNYAEFTGGFNKNFKNGVHMYVEGIITTGHRRGGGGHIGFEYEF